MKRCILFLLALLLTADTALALSVRSIGMGSIYSPIAHDSTGIFDNPAFLARNDAVRFSFDDTTDQALSLSIGDFGLAGSASGATTTYHLAQGFNTYSFLRLGLGAIFTKTQHNFNLGIDLDMGKYFGASFALLNENNVIANRNFITNLYYKTEDHDMGLAISRSDNGNLKFGFEKQFSPKAFYRFGYNVDHPSLGITLPLQQNIDLDLALEFSKDNSQFFWGVNLFRNTENKRVNSNHSINFGKAIVGEDKFITIEGFNLHYVDTGPPAKPTPGTRDTTLVLIGGGIHYTHHWDPYMKAFAEKYRVINIDHVGAGESDKPQYFFGYTVEEQAEIINALLDQIGVKEAFLLGYCYGGSIAFYLAGEYPEKYKKLVEIEGFVNGINTIPIFNRNKYREEAIDLRHDVEYLNAYLVKDFITASYRLDYPYFNTKMWYQVNKSILYIDLRETIRELKVPVLYYAGTKSWAKNLLDPTKNYIRKNIKNLQYVEIDGAEHDADKFDRERFMKGVLTFLSHP